MKHRLIRCAIPMLLMLLSPALQSAVPEEETVLDEVVVVGEVPGPALWKVRKGEHVLWILGTNSPLPKDIKWKSGEVEGVLAKSQEVLYSASVRRPVGAFKALTLLPSLVGIRKSPEGKKLNEILPADLYAQWQVLKARYIGRDNDVESWRPIFAAEYLYRKALDKEGLGNSSMVGKLVRSSAGKFNLKSTTPLISLPIDKPRQLIRDFKKAEVADMECFAQTIERMEKDLALVRTRANAWARGNLPLLRRLAPARQASACIDAIMNSRLGKDYGFADLQARFEQAWLAAADTALARNASTFTTLPISDLFKADGTLSKLRERGYTIEEP